MKKKFFTVLHRSKNSKARLGTINTFHGTVQTPAFVPVGTKGTIKALPQPFFKDIGIQLAFVNTYHLVIHPGPDVISKAGGIHKFSQMNIPLMSDSGGFQVFSLAQNTRKAKLQADDSNIGIIATQHKGEGLPLVVKISEDGVKFRSLYEGQLVEFTPEKSMEYQKIIGADLMMAFDECTYYPATHEYAEKAMKRTHEWLKRCIVAVESRKSIKSKANNINFNDLMDFKDFTDFKTQFLYGIIQGATYEDLRVASAQFINEQDVPGVAIGGVSVGETKEEMRKQVQWVAPYLPLDKPVHLLGVGHVDDIINLVKYGIDTFDCVEPTRLARMGRIYQTKTILKYVETCHGMSLQKDEFDFDIQKSIYKSDLSPVDESCDCYVCQNYSKSYLHHLFKQKEILGYTLASYHNLAVMEKLMGEIRLRIQNDQI